MVVGIGDGARKEEYSVWGHKMSTSERKSHVDILYTSVKGDG